MTYLEGARGVNVPDTLLGGYCNPPLVCMPLLVLHHLESCPSPFFKGGMGATLGYKEAVHISSEFRGGEWHYPPLWGLRVAFKGILSFLYRRVSGCVWGCPISSSLKKSGKGGYGFSVAESTMRLLQFQTKLVLFPRLQQSLSTISEGCERLHFGATGNDS